MEEAVEHGGDRSAVTKKFSPVLHRAVRSQRVLVRSQRRMTILTKRSSAAVDGSLRMPRSSMMSSGT